MMRVSVVGAGYVGLVTGVGLAEKGLHVTCVDSDPTKVAQIRSGVPPFFEPGLPEMMTRALAGRLEVTSDLRLAVEQSDLTLIAVGTPSLPDGRIDVSGIEAVARQLGEILRDKPAYHVVVIKSTVVPGTTDDVVRSLLEEVSGKRAGADFGLGVNPEFLTEGEAVQDFMQPDRIVLGAIDDRTMRALEQLYAGFPDVALVRTTPRAAEMIKYTSNALLATLISFSNEVGNLCAAVGGVDVADVMRALHLSRYVTSTLADGTRVTAPLAAFLWAGCGFGGSCLPKDVRALIARGREAGQPMRLLDAVIQTNERQPSQVLALVRKHYSSLTDVRVAVLGLAFRPDTSDIRESPAIQIIRDLIAAGATLTAYDPAATTEARHVLGNGRVRVVENLADAIAEAQVVVIVTRWEEFASLPGLLHHRHPAPLVVDARRMLEKSAVERYEGIGL